MQTTAESIVHSTFRSRLIAVSASIALVLGGIAAIAHSDQAGAATPATLTYTNAGTGTVSLNPTNPDALSDLTPTAGIPYSSGQYLTLDVAPNSVLSFPSLGYGNGFVVIQCTDADGQPDDLPTLDSSCDPNTLTEVSGRNYDGSLTVDTSVYSTPDINIEDGASAITCDAANQCVFLITTTYATSGSIDSYPHLFSAPFEVVPSPSDSGANPGDGTPEVPYPLGLPVLAFGLIGGWAWHRRRRSI